jgi:hypothetical protein
MTSVFFVAGGLLGLSPGTPLKVITANIKIARVRFRIEILLSIPGPESGSSRAAKRLAQYVINSREGSAVLLLRCSHFPRRAGIGSPPALFWDGPAKVRRFYKSTRNPEIEKVTLTVEAPNSSKARTTCPSA